MLELHGWITIRESFKADSEDDNIEEIVSKISSYIDRLKCASDLFKLDFYNGTPSLTIALFKNHFSQEVQEVFKLINFITEIANGSYGLVYLHDDENKKGKENLFQVYSIARGKISEYEDPFLSPLIPKIEDAPV